jgi:hypothetical protein
MDRGVNSALTLLTSAQEVKCNRMLQYNIPAPNLLLYRVKLVKSKNIHNVILGTLLQLVPLAVCLECTLHIKDTRFI